MSNRVLRDWTNDRINDRLNEIDMILKSMPKVKDGNILQAEKWSLYVEKRNLRIRKMKLAGKSHTFKQELELIKSSGGICEICGSNKNPSIDHIIPLSKGGTDALDNLRVICISCNSKKGNRI